MFVFLSSWIEDNSLFRNCAMKCIHDERNTLLKERFIFFLTGFFEISQIAVDNDNGNKIITILRYQPTTLQALIATFVRASFISYIFVLPLKTDDFVMVSEIQWKEAAQHCLCGSVTFSCLVFLSFNCFSTTSSNSLAFIGIINIISSQIQAVTSGCKLQVLTLRTQVLTYLPKIYILHSNYPCNYLITFESIYYVYKIVSMDILVTA